MFVIMAIMRFELQMDVRLPAEIDAMRFPLKIMGKRDVADVMKESTQANQDAFGPRDIDSGIAAI